MPKAKEFFPWIRRFGFAQRIPKPVTRDSASLLKAYHANLGHTDDILDPSEDFLTISGGEIDRRFGAGTARQIRFAHQNTPPHQLNH